MSASPRRERPGRRQGGDHLGQTADDPPADPAWPTGLTSSSCSQIPLAPATPRPRLSTCSGRLIPRSRTSMCSSLSSMRATGSAQATVSSLLVFELEVPVVIVVNKVDRLKPGHIASQMQTASQLGDFHALHPVSAKTGDGGRAPGRARCATPGWPCLLSARSAHRPLGRGAVAELVREKAIQLTRDEVPHSVTAEVEEIEGKVVRVAIYVETDLARSSSAKEARDGARDRDACAAGDRGVARPAGVPRARCHARPKWRRDERSRSGSVLTSAHFGSFRSHTRANLRD